MKCSDARHGDRLRILVAALSFGMAGSLAETASGADATAREIGRGRYLAIAADCAACHTVHSGLPYAGGYGIPSPFGTIYSTNITPSRSYGIGTYSEADFARVLRQGVTPEGKYLYPAMPYTSYTNLTDADIRSLYVYFMNAVKPVEQMSRPTRLMFPLNMRFLMIGWNWLYLKKQRMAVPGTATSQVARGAYLATALAHCDVCHTPRNFLMAEIPDRNLGGAALSSWYAPDITPDYPSGISTWTDEQLRLYLRTGNAPDKAQAAGPMAEAVEKSFQHLSGRDIDALIAYLRQVPPVGDPAYKRPRDSFGAPSHMEAAIRGSRVDTRTHGELLYSRECASCHQPSGKGSRDGYYPPLFHNTATGAPDPGNLISVVLHGVRRNIDGRIVYMPGFGPESPIDHLSDQDIADVVNEVETSFGDPEVRITQEDVRNIRNEGRFSLSVTTERMVSLGGTILVLALVSLGIVLIRRRRAARRRL